MARDKRNRSKVNHLEGTLRYLEKENRQLKHQLARADKAVQQLHHHIDDQVEVTPKVVQELPKCPDCGHTVSVIDFGVKLVVSCKNCGYRQTTKKIEE